MQETFLEGVAVELVVELVAYILVMVTGWGLARWKSLPQWRDGFKSAKSPSKVQVLGVSVVVVVIIAIIAMVVKMRLFPGRYTTLKKQFVTEIAEQRECEVRLRTLFATELFSSRISGDASDQMLRQACKTALQR